jgi:hypothetical protein
MQYSHWQEIRFWHALIVLVVSLLVACTFSAAPVTPTATLDPAFIDRSIVTGIPCLAPCWYGLKLDHSTKADVLATAQNLTFVDTKKFPEEPYNYWEPSKQTQVVGTLIRLQCRQPEAQTCAGLLLFSDVLKQIYLFPRPTLDFAQVVSSLGPPEYVQAVPRMDTPVLCDVALIWKQRGITVAFVNGFPQKDQVRCEDIRSGKGINPDLPAEHVVYALPDDPSISTVPELGRDFFWPGFLKR